MRPFVQQLKNALRDNLEPYFDEELYIDEDRLKPGFKFNEALATAICESLCMIVVYVPKYERHEYCRREYAAMEQLEQQRLKTLGCKLNPKLGMIIPVVLRGGGTDANSSGLPAQIKQCRHYADFSKYTTATPNISANLEYVEKIRSIAESIYELHKEIESSGIEICASCNEFQLPKDVPRWCTGEQAASAPLPGREASK